MKKEANEQGEVQAVPLTDETGAAISSETTFTPQAEHGSIEVSFNFNASALEPGAELVVYEKLLCNETEIATHEDPEDENQTVRVVAPEEPPAPSNPDEPAPASETPTPEQKGTFAKTGSALVPLLVAAGIVALSGAVLAGISYRHYLRGRSSRTLSHATCSAMTEDNRKACALPDLPFQSQKRPGEPSCCLHALGNTSVSLSWRSC